MTTHGTRGPGTRTAAVALVAFGVLGLIWFGLELAPPVIFGFTDTDDPRVSLRFLRAHSMVYAWAGLVLVAMAGSLVAGVHAVSPVLARGAGVLTVRWLGTVGSFASAFFLGHGVLRLAVNPLLYIDGLDPEWGESAYLAMQMVGIHGFGQGAILALCAWAVGVCIVGYRTRTLPRFACILGVLPGLRLLSILGPLGVADAVPFAWLLLMASVPGTYVWSIVLGGSLAARARTKAAEVQHPSREPHDEGPAE